MGPKKRKIVEGQKTLFACGVSRPPQEQEATTATETSIELEETKKAQISRKFQTRWLESYKWLRYDAAKDEMTCDLCVQSSRVNVFTRGCNNFKTSTLADHIKSNDHQTALISPSLRSDMQKLQAKHHSAKEKAALVALRSVYWLVKENIPLSKFHSFIAFQKGVGVEDLAALTVSPGVSYVSDYAAHEFLKALSETIESDTKSALQNSPYVTVLADESTDRTITHRLVIYCQIIDIETMTPTTQFLTNIQLDSGTGAAVSSAIYSELEMRGVKAEKIMGLGTDGAAAMTGN